LSLALFSRTIVMISAATQGSSSHARAFFTVTLVTIRPGHEREFEDIHRTLKSARQRAGVLDNRAVYQMVSGMARNMYLIFSAHRSLQNAGVALDPAADDYSTDVDDPPETGWMITRASLFKALRHGCFP